MTEEEDTNNENIKQMLLLAYNTWWKVQAVTNMAELKRRTMSKPQFDTDKEKQEFKNLIDLLINGMYADLILDVTKNHKTQYLKTGTPPFDIIPVCDGVSLQNEVDEDIGRMTLRKR